MGLQVYILEGKQPKLVPIEQYDAWTKELMDRTGSPAVQVAYTHIHHVCEVSTIFFGMMPTVDWVFETKIFGGKFDQWEERYATWEEAERGHAEAVKMVKKNIN